MPGGNTGLKEPLTLVAPSGESDSRPASRPARLAQTTFALYLILLLGANGVASSQGPLAWLPLVRLPGGGNEWVGIGVAGLLPLLSAGVWLGQRARQGRLRALDWGPRRVAWPLLALAALGALSLAGQCAGGVCNPAAAVRLALLLAHLAWVYLYVVNERPPLFAIVVIVIALQSTVALGQFITQRNLGLALLGEPALDPQQTGVSVVMRGATRWLRAHGLTNHPNVLAGTLVTMLLMLPVLAGDLAPNQRRALPLLLALGCAALFATLARWAAVCFALGLGLNLAPWLMDGLRRRRWTVGPWAASMALAVGLTAGLMLAVYGDAVVGRAVGLETPVENRSLWERERDTTIAARLLAGRPLTGVGLGGYLSHARAVDRWAETVHNVPLLLGAELGLPGLLLWLVLLVAPVLRRGALGRYAPQTALWLGFWLLGVLYPAPHPLLELRSALLAGLAAGLVAVSSPLRQLAPSQRLM